MDINITIISPVYCKIEAGVAKLIRPLLSFDYTIWRQQQFRKVPKTYQKSTIIMDGARAFFFTGFLRRVTNHLESNGHKVNIINSIGDKLPTTTPSIKLREDQEKLVMAFLRLQRGLLVAPTGSGKTVLGVAIVSALPKSAKVLWLCHTLDLLNQTAEEFIKFGETSIGKIGDGFCDVSKRITIATRQSFSSLLANNSASIPYYDVIIVDEAHHVTSFGGEYATILARVQAPVRLGLTATPPTQKEAVMCVEALIGPRVATLTLKRGNEIGIIAKPIVRLIRLPNHQQPYDRNKYSQIYEDQIVNSNSRNLIITEIAKEHVSSNDSVLIMTTRIEHGENLLRFAETNGVNAVFIQGSTDSEARTKIKHALNNKEIKCVICTTIWNEGVNIPELNVIINACGGKSEIKTLQSLGRGLRVTENKRVIILYDFLDTARYLAEHAIQRIGVFVDNGWLSP